MMCFLIFKENEILPNRTLANVNVRGSRLSETEYFVDGVKMKSEDNNEIQFQKIKIQTSIYVKFSIK